MFSFQRGDGFIIYLFADGWLIARGLRGSCGWAGKWLGNECPWQMSVWILHLLLMADGSHHWTVIDGVDFTSVFDSLLRPATVSGQTALHDFNLFDCSRLRQEAVIIHALLYFFLISPLKSHLHRVAYWLQIAQRRSIKFYYWLFQSNFSHFL